MGQNHIHVSKVRHTSEFLFSIYWWILKNQKNQTFEKMKTFAGDIIILHMCTKNHNHMRYSSWDTKWDGIFCHFGPYFAFLTPSPPKPNNLQNQNLKKNEKNIYRCHHFKLVLQKNTIIWFMLTQIWSSCIDIIFLSFQVIFCFFVPLLTPKIKIWKKCKKYQNILSFYTCVPLINIIWCMVPEIWSSPWKMRISKMKKNPGEIILLHKCTKNHDHLLYCPKDIVHVRCNCYFHIGPSDIFPSTFP